MSNAFQGKVALITGAAQGLGEAIARRVAAEGMDVALLDVNADALEQTAEQVAQSSGRKALACPADVTDAAQMESAFDDACRRLGGLDVVVANAGIVMSAPVSEFDAADWRRVVDVNLTGYFLTARCAVPKLRAQGGGVILQINSISGKRGSFRNSAYCASKAAGIGLTQSLALEVADAGIRVNAICPGHLLDSPLWTERLYGQYARRWQISEAEVRRRYIESTPMRRPCTYEDVCNVVVFLASPHASYLTGQAINVNGGAFFG